MYGHGHAWLCSIHQIKPLNEVKQEQRYKESRMRKMSSAVALAVLITISSGCSHYHLRASGERVNSSPFRKTFNSSSRGERTIPPADSGAQGSSGLPSS